MSNERIWVTKERREVKIKDMDDQHLVNSTRMILGRGFRKDYLRDLVKEMSRRKVRFTFSGTIYDGSYLTIDTMKVQEKKDKNSTKKAQWSIIRRPKSTEVA